MKDGRKYTSEKYIYILTKIISLCNHVVEKYMENKNGDGKGYLVVDEKYK